VHRYAAYPARFTEKKTLITDLTLSSTKAAGGCSVERQRWWLHSREKKGTYIDFSPPLACEPRLLLVLSCCCRAINHASSQSVSQSISQTQPFCLQ
jgi:hypothetical protein